jgi:hypothetical protein
VKSLQISGESFGVIHAKKTVRDSRIWLTAKPDETWWIVVEGPDQTIRTVGLVRPPQEKRAWEIYEDFSKPNVLEAFLEGRDS